MNSLYMASNAWCVVPLNARVAPKFTILCLALSSVSALPPAAQLAEVSNELVEASETSDGNDEEQCLLQTHTEVRFRANKVPSESSMESPGALQAAGIVQDVLTMAVDNVDPLEDKPEEEKTENVHDSQAESVSTGVSLLSTARESHVLGGLLKMAATQSAADGESQTWLAIAIIVMVFAIAGTIAVCFSMENTKDPYQEPLKRTPRGSLRPPPPPPRPDTRPQPGYSAASDVAERTGSRSSGKAYGTREALQRELRGAVSLASSSQSPMSTGSHREGTSMRSPIMSMGTAAPMSAAQQEPLCASLVMSHGEAAYLLPDLSHMSRPVEAFDITNQSGACVLGVVVNDGSEDPGILLHAPRTADGAGLPLAFIGTSMALRHAGSLPIARPCVDKKHGEFFANLNRDIQGGGYSVRKDGLAFMRFEGDFVERSIRLYDKASNTSIGFTKPLGEARDGQFRFELQLNAGKDAALAILCLLAICRLENARHTALSSSQGSVTSMHLDPGAGAGQQGPLFSLGGLQGLR